MAKTDWRALKKPRQRIWHSSYTSAEYGKFTSSSAVFAEGSYLHRCCGYELKAQASRSLLEAPYHSLQVLLFVHSRTGLDVFFTVFDEPVVESSQLVCCGRHRFWTSKPRFHPSIVRAQI